MSAIKKEFSKICPKIVGEMTVYKCGSFDKFLCFFLLFFARISHGFLCKLTNICSLCSTFGNISKFIVCKISFESKVVDDSRRLSFQLISSQVNIFA